MGVFFFFFFFFVFFFNQLFDQSFQELSTSSLGLKYKAKKSLWSGFLFGFASISIKYLSPFQNR